jgi:hypothetical protein
LSHGREINHQEGEELLYFLCPSKHPETHPSLELERPILGNPFNLIGGKLRVLEEKPAPGHWDGTQSRLQFGLTAPPPVFFSPHHVTSCSEMLCTEWLFLEVFVVKPAAHYPHCFLFTFYNTTVIFYK